MRRREFLQWGAGLGLATWLGCGREIDELLLGARVSADVGLDGLKLVARIAHVTDTHIVDEESPARFAGAHAITHAAWRLYEAYSTQLLDGIIRTANRIHASGRTIDFLLHTGDACDNTQSNELAWLLRVLDGGEINPLTGPDDRSPDARPDPLLDPHTPFGAQGLYQCGVHGDLPSVPWYALLGNHDVHAIGTFPIFENEEGRRTAPLPLEGRAGVLLPVRLDPLASSAHGNVTPADPGPPCLLEIARFVPPNAARAFFDRREFADALADAPTGPAGHGFTDTAGEPRVYSVSPVAGLRLIGLDTTDAVTKIAGGLYFEGAVSRRQAAFLRAELEAAAARDEIVVVASHHPSAALTPLAGSEATGEEFRAVLHEYTNVVLHLCGHQHRNRVIDRGSYLEIETCSTLDLPQEGRLIEIWQDEHTGDTVIAYEMFSHVDDTLPALGDDPLRPLREQAHAVALEFYALNGSARALSRTSVDTADTGFDCCGKLKSALADQDAPWPHRRVDPGSPPQKGTGSEPIGAHGFGNRVPRGACTLLRWTASAADPAGTVRDRAAIVSIPR